MSQLIENDNKFQRVPFSRSYWVVPGKLLAGYCFADSDPEKTEENVRKLISSGIRYVIDLTEENERIRYADHFTSYEKVFMRSAKLTGFNVPCVRRPTKDLVAPTPEFIRNVLDEIDNAIAQGKPVYVHCWGGKGRTGVVVGCYLARHGYAQGQDILDLIEKLRHNDPDVDHPSPETQQQRDMVTAWQEGAVQ